MNTSPFVGGQSVAVASCWARLVLRSPAVRPEVRQLQYFIAAADELSFTRAAERLNVVQQTLSTAIAQLEALLGIKLFERTTRRVTLTKAGAAWLPYAREALAAADRAAEAARDLAAGRSGRLRVGLAATAALDLTPRVLRAFAERYPLVELTIEHFDCQDPSGGLHDRRSDVAIVRPPFRDEGLDLVVIGSEPRFAVLAADHLLADREALEFAELADEPWADIATDPLWWDFWRVAERRSGPPTQGRRRLPHLQRAPRGRSGRHGDGAGRGIGGPRSVLASARICRGARHRPVDARDRLALGKPPARRA
jgi:DNA-binding transcriptional LysR family regulator